MEVSGKIITSLHERRTIERGIRDLLDIRSEKELERQARLVAEGGEQVIPAILSHLGHVNPRMVNALGIVSSLHPDRTQVTDRLYQVAADVSVPDEKRLAAMAILERFLGVRPDPSLVETLSDPRTMLVESVKEMIRDGEQNPFLLLEYARSLATQPDEVMEGVVETLRQTGQERAVPALCLLAQAQAEPLAATALVELGRLRHPDAMRGLQTVLPMLPPARRPLVERSLRKLQLSGVPPSPLPAVDGRWRALVSPVDGQGNQVVWFVHDADPTGHCSFMGVSLREQGGIAQAYGNMQVLAAVLPERRPMGYVHPLAPQEGLILHMLEADFDYGRRLVREGQSLNFELGQPPPVEYNLLGTLIWQYDDAHVEESREGPPMPQDENGLLPETAILLDHPAFKSWLAHGDQVVQHVLTMIRWLPPALQRNRRAMAIQLAEAYFDGPTIDRQRVRLEAMAEWLWRAGQAHQARVALVAARTIADVPAAVHPFALRMAERGLRAVTEQLQAQLEQNRFSGSNAGPRVQ